MLQVKAYYSAAIRGPAGNDATDAEINKNLQKACQQAHRLQQIFGELLDIYCPHQHDQIIQILWRKNQIIDKDILDADLQIQAECDMTVVNQTIKSGGVDLEVKNAQAQEKPHPLVFIDDELTDKDISVITQLIVSILQQKLQNQWDQETD